MSTSAKKARGGGGIAWLMVALFGVATAVGLALDFGANSGAPGFWIGAQPGARALLGVGAGAFVVAAAQLARLILARPSAEGDDARDHA